MSSPASKPRVGSSSADGGASITSSPFCPTSASFSGLNSRLPASVMAVTMSGEATNACVAGLESLRAAKLRLKEEMIEFLDPFSTSVRFHCPMHGPHAFASTVPPALTNVSSRPSRLMVARICSEPGVMLNGIFALTPIFAACRTMLAARPMSS